MKQSILLTVLLFILTSTSYSFDGQRKGFVLGGGLGICAVSHWSVNVDFYDLDVADANEERVGLGLHILIGGSFDEHNMLIYESNVSGFNSELLNESIGQGFSGAAWYHYFSSAGNSAFTALGLGFYQFKVGDYDATNPGGALLLGAGYEFSRHWQIGAYLTFGKTTESAFGLNADFEHANLSILISGIAY
ncbi:MAG: hypothetical protein ABIJ12_04705 [bacterium]